MRSFIVIAATLVALYQVTLLASAQEAQTRTMNVNCNQRTACYPWRVEGPTCNRGNRMNLRFMLQVAAENYNATGTYAENVTFPFCPVVDELQAFNLSDTTRLSMVHSPGMTQDPLTLEPIVDWRHADIRQVYLYGIGLGDRRNTEIP